MWLIFIVSIFCLVASKVDLEIEWVLQGSSLSFDGFLFEVLGFALLDFPFPQFRIVPSYSKRSFDDETDESKHLFFDQMFVDEGIAAHLLFGMFQRDISKLAEDNAAEAILRQQKSSFCDTNNFLFNVSYIGGPHTRPYVFGASTAMDCCNVCEALQSCLAWSFWEQPNTLCELKGTDVTINCVASEYNSDLQNTSITSGGFSTNNKIIRRSLPKVLIFHGTTCFYNNMTLGKEVKRNINIIWIGRFMLERSDYSRGLLQAEAVTLKCASIMDEVWVPTDWMKSVFSDLFLRFGFPSPHIEVVPEAVNTNRFDPSDADPSDYLPARLHVLSNSSCSTQQNTMKNSDDHTCYAKSRPFQFLSIFKWEYRKGWDVLLRAYWTAFSTTDNIVLHLHTYIPSFDKGSASIEERIETFAWDAFGKSSRDLALVTWDTASLSRPAVRNLLSAANAFVLATRGEGWGLPVAEAMAMRLPVLVSNCTGPIHFANDSNAYMIPVLDGYDDYGYCVPNTTALMHLMKQVVEDHKDPWCNADDPGADGLAGDLEWDARLARRRRGEEARRTMERLSPERVLGIMESRIRALAGQRGWNDLVTL